MVKRLLIFLLPASLAFAFEAASYLYHPGIAITDSGTSRTLSAADNGKIIQFSSASAVTVTYPAGLGNQFHVTLIATGAGGVTVSASGTTLRQAGSSLGTVTRYMPLELYAYATDIALVDNGLPVNAPLLDASNIWQGSASAKTQAFNTTDTSRSGITLSYGAASDSRLTIGANYMDSTLNSDGVTARTFSFQTSGGAAIFGGALRLYSGSAAPSTFTTVGSMYHDTDTDAITVRLTSGTEDVVTIRPTETLSYSSTTVTVTAGHGPNQSSVLTCTNNFTLAFTSVADNDGGTIWVHPAATNCTVTLSSPAYGPSGPTLTITGGTGSTNHTVLAWKATTVNSTNVINVNALNYYR